jgi:hypothetical protein
MIKYFCFALIFCLIHGAVASIPEKDLRVIQGALLPENDPLKARLDAFFSQKRWTFSSKSMKEGGFTSCKPRPFSLVIVTRHPDFPGYLFKICLDVQRVPSNKEDYFLWKKRVDGIENIRRYVTEKGWQETFAMPRKWIYLLPDLPKCPKGYIPKSSILIVEDVGLVSEDENKKLWSSDQITETQLYRLYWVLKHCLLGDCTIITNIPLTHTGKIAFIDTQIWGSKEINWDYLNKALSPKNRAYWKKITGQ